MTVEKVIKVGEEYRVMYLGVKNVRDVKLIFSILSVKKLNKYISQKLRGFIDRRNLAGNLCNTSPRTHHNFVGCDDFLKLSIVVSKFGI